MRSIFQRCLTDLDRASGLDELQYLAEQLRDHYEVRHFVYLWVCLHGGNYGCGTFPEHWVNRYRDKDYIRVDPVVLGCQSRFDPVDWRALDWSSKTARAFQADALAHGVGNLGYSAPVRGPGGQFAILSLSDVGAGTGWSQFTAAHRSEIIALAYGFNSAALRLERIARPATGRPLSPREVDALTHLAEGKSRERVAEALQISQHTLRAYIESARLKLGATNTTHAVALALSEGQIVAGSSVRRTGDRWPGLLRRQSVG